MRSYFWCASLARHARLQVVRRRVYCCCDLQSQCHDMLCVASGLLTGSAAAHWDQDLLTEALCMVFQNLLLESSPATLAESKVCMQHVAFFTPEPLCSLHQAQASSATVLQYSCCHTS